MSSSPTRVLFAALFLGVASLAHAQSPSASPAASVPRVVRVDGQFVPANGLPPAATEVVTLSLYAAETDVTPLWEETQEVRVDAQGRYAIFLGGTNAEGLPPGLFAAGEPRWLGMRFARPGEAEPARVLLTSVPYALRASDADTLGGLPPSAFLRAENGTDDATTPAGRAAGAAGARGPGPSVSTGTPNYIGKFVDAVDLTSSALYESAGRIGLGTTTPLDFLHTRFSDTTGSFTGLAVQNMSGSATSYSGMLFYDHTGALGQFQGFNNSTKEYRINNIATGGTINFMLGSASRFQVRADGDIAISGNIRNGAGPFLASSGTNSLSVGNLAMPGNTGLDNTAVGTFALQTTTAGANNTAVGSGAARVTNGSGNTVVGSLAMTEGQGDGNTVVGTYAALDKITGNYNLYLGYNVANDAANVESSTIRVGDSVTYSRFFAGGVRGVTTGVADAVAVVIDSNGQLGTVNSSRRYKEDIQDMGEASSALMQLRPVTYRYTQAFANGAKPIDYGLIAEEVKEVYPDLVAHLANGEVETVQYHKINAMLLNEVQKQHREIGDLKARLEALERLLTTEKK